jgi:hypothetical protein
MVAISSDISVMKEKQVLKGRNILSQLHVFPPLIPIQPFFSFFRRRLEDKRMSRLGKTPTRSDGKTINYD